MKHQFLKLAIGLSLSIAVALPAAGDPVHDAIECEQFLVMSAGYVPPGSDAETQVKEMTSAWSTHVKLLTGEAETLTEDRAQINQALFQVMSSGDAAQQQALKTSLQRCTTRPDFETATYPDLTCARLAHYVEKASEDAIAQQEAKAAGFESAGETDKAAIAQGYVDAARQRRGPASAIKHAFFNAQPNTRVEPHHFGLFGDESEPVLAACTASMGLDE